MRKYIDKGKSGFLGPILNGKGILVEPCSYIVVDLDTGLLLANGVKYRCMHLTTECGTYKLPGPFGKRYPLYKREVDIKGRLCVIFYLTGCVRRFIGSTVASPGRLLGLRGEFYSPISDDVIQCSTFLLEHGYELLETK